MGVVKIHQSFTLAYLFPGCAMVVLHCVSLTGERRILVFLLIDWSLV